jgi:nitronate monooxygenase
MTKAEELRSQTVLPVVVAPMFLVSGVDLVVAACQAGVIGAFPALNGRTPEAFGQMLEEITSRLEAYRRDHPQAVVSLYGVNLIVHKSNPRWEGDLELCVRHRVPMVITSLGKPSAVVEAVHAYGGTVLSDVINVEHAKKAAACGVDGLILVCAGAGGHAGRYNPLAFVPAVREFFDGILVVAGCISTGGGVRAVTAIGGDFAYMGTRFIPTAESRAQDDYKRMILDSSIGDIVYTPAVSGVHASFLRESLERAGYDLERLGAGAGELDVDMENEAKVWRDTWSAGQGVHVIHEISTVREVVELLKSEYRSA